MHLKHCSEKGFVSVPALPEGSVGGGRKLRKPCLQAAWKPLCVSLEGAPVSESGSSSPWVRRAILKYRPIRWSSGTFLETGVQEPQCYLIPASHLSLEWALSLSHRG